MKPTSPSDPRPDDEPYYIDSDCPECGTSLILHAESLDREISEDEIWHDEWVCPNEDCEKEGIFLDVPDEFVEEIKRRKQESSVSFESLSY